MVAACVGVDQIIVAVVGFVTPMVVVVVPDARGVKFVAAEPEPPLIITGDVIVPTVGLLLVRETVTLRPPASGSAYE
jgi:hypothetical protein